MGKQATGRPAARQLVVVAALILGAYLVVRAVAEPFVIDLADPASYRNDWGGPSLAGVLAVHMLPGVISLTLLILWLRRKRTAKHPASR